MIPIGTGLAGLLVRLSEPSLGRSVALTVPLWTAGLCQMLGCLVVLPLLARGWRNLGLGRISV